MLLKHDDRVKCFDINGIEMGVEAVDNKTICLKMMSRSIEKSHDVVKLADKDLAVKAT